MYNSIPVILLKELIILPNQEIKIELNNLISRKIIKYAIDNNLNVLVVTPLNIIEEEPSVDDLPKIGVIAKVKNRIQLADGSIRITLRGIGRCSVKKYIANYSDIDILDGIIEPVIINEIDEIEQNVIRRKLIDSLKEYISSSDNVSNSIMSQITDDKSLDTLTDIIAAFLPFDINKKLDYMQNVDPLARAKQLINDITEEIKLNELDDEIDDLTHEKISEDSRKYILKEKIKTIKNELGEVSVHEEDVYDFKERLNKLKISKETKLKIEQEIKKFESLNDVSPEIGLYRNYLDWVINLPWNKLSKDETNANVVEKILNESHYGLEEVKQRIVEYVAIKNINKDIKSPIICLVGPPGVGKTSIAISIANALNKKFYKISVGGLNDSAELIGHRRTYLGANPGKIIQGLKKCGVKNPVFLIDEVDKMLRDYKGDPASTLLEIIDPIQNNSFVDNYIEEPFDLSEVLFILTANSTSDIPSTILDRVEIINLNSYTLFEKKDIAFKYILPRIFAEHKIYNYQMTLEDEEIISYIIKNYTNEAGVRELERTLSTLTRKRVINKIKSLDIAKVIELLGKPKYQEDNLNLEKIGVVNNLAVTSFGGSVSKIESVKFKGNGNLIITGSAGDVLKESITVALSYLRSEYGINTANIDLHLHFPASSIKKDGPSGGVGIATSILSLLLKKNIASDVAFTGEISLNGQILKIGGLKEKLIAAYNNDIKTVYIPSANKSDLEELPSYLLKKLTIITVNDYQEIYTKFFK